MPYDESAAARVRTMLRESKSFSERKMMGSLCFMVDEYMCCGITGADLMIRVGAASYAETLTRTHVKPLEMSGRRPRGFVLIEPAGYRTKPQLSRWLRQALDVVDALPPKRR